VSKKDLTASEVGELEAFTLEAVTEVTGEYFKRL
jgi:hypothetical protein